MGYLSCVNIGVRPAAGFAIVLAITVILGTGRNANTLDNGARLVDEAGRSMHDIVAKVRRISDLTEAVNHVSAGQSEGNGQIGDAVQQLDKVKQQNAVCVEESVAVKSKLKHQAHQLAERVARFKVEHAQTPVTP